MALKKVKVRVNKKEYDAEFSWDEKSQEGIASVTIDAPDITSWNLESHYYPIEIQLEGVGGWMGIQDYLTTMYTDKDKDFGEKLRLYVKEKNAPIINLIHPLDGYYLTERDNEIMFYILDEIEGSRIDYRTLKVVCADIDITDTVHAVECDNGYYCKTKIPNTEEGVYSLEICVSDYDKNCTEIKINYEYLVLISDRTQEDVNYALTQPDTSKHLKGSYNYSDMNRVEKSVRYMSRRLRAYNLNPITKIDWKNDDIPRAIDGIRYLKNVQDIKNVFLFDVVDIPTTMNRLTYIGANNIEEAIIQTDKKLNDIYSQNLYSGEIYGGDI